MLTMRTLIVPVALLLGCATLLADSARSGALTIEALLDIKHPSRTVWSPDGRSIAFVWDRAGVQNVWLVGSAGGQPLALTSYQDGLIDALFWARDSQSVFFSRGRDLWQASISGGDPRPVWTTRASEDGITPSPDVTRVAFERDGDIWTRALGDGTEVRLTRTPVAESGAVWSPDGARVAFSVTPVERREEATGYTGAKLLFTRLERQPADVAVMAAAGGASVVVAGSPGTESAPRWIDASRLSLQRVTEDLTTREVIAADLVRGHTEVLHRDVDAKWWSLTYLNPEPVPSPDGRWVAFISDRDGFDHLYVVPAAGGSAVQVTSGPYEVSRLRWAPDSTRIAFDTNEGAHPGSRHLAAAELGRSNQPRFVLLTRGRGTDTEPAWSPDGLRLVYQHTDPRTSADLFVVDAQPGAAPRRLTTSMPPSIDRDALIEPKFVRYPAPDGAQVPSYLFEPNALDRSRRHPAIVWVHGDGVTQNYDGWHLRRDYAVYYSFHQYLVQRGYVVLAVDYRGSIGYGKEWRQGHFRDLGGKDYQDVAAGVAYLKSLAYVDSDRIGVWGLSYGGFMTLQALTVTPDLFRCGIDVAGVVDWRDWYRDPNGPWIKGRMGSPEENPALYQRTAPIERVDRIVKPLLVLHGTADVNVPFLESVRLVDVLTKAGKPVEFMMYPGEFHYFHREHVLRDAWTKVEEFFNRHLKQSPRPSSAGQEED